MYRKLIFCFMFLFILAANGADNGSDVLIGGDWNLNAPLSGVGGRIGILGTTKSRMIGVVLGHAETWKGDRFKQMSSYMQIMVSPLGAIVAIGGGLSIDYTRVSLKGPNQEIAPCFGAEIAIIDGFGFHLGYFPTNNISQIGITLYP